jgi:hypothetical protein
MIALKARSKAFRIAVQILHPQRNDLKQNLLRCPDCAGELRLEDHDLGTFVCMECDQRYRGSWPDQSDSELEYESVDSPTFRRAREASRWGEAVLLLMVGLAIVFALAAFLVALMN